MHKILNTNTISVPSSLFSNPDITLRPVTFQRAAHLEITAVLVEGIVGDYAVYIGHGSPDFVAAHGNKLSFKQALCHFPQLDETKYRS